MLSATGEGSFSGDLFLVKFFLVNLESSDMAPIKCLAAFRNFVKVLLATDITQLSDLQQRLRFMSNLN